MALIETIGVCSIGKRFILQGRQFIQKSPWNSTGWRTFDRQSQNQTRFFRGRSGNPDGKKIGLGPDVELFPFQQNVKGLSKPILFTVAFCSCSFAGAAIWQYETMRSHARRTWERSVNIFREQWGYNHKFGHWRNEINQRWRSLSEGQRLALGLIGANLFIFLLWRIPRLQPIMVKYFCSNPAAKALCWPMVLSTFSHYSFLHLFFNMYVLYSFSTGLGNILGHEQFLAMYLSAGVFSSLTSYVHKVLTVKPGLSLGASGCLMGVLGFFCMQFPDAQLGIVFLPMVTFSASAALKAIIALDSVGVLLGWKLFDHAAHLGGVAFGVSYAVWGRQYIWEAREPFVRWWNNLRGSPYK